MPKTIAIGDLHGHYDQFLDLMEKLKAKGIDFNTDTLVFLGDFVDGGPGTKDVLDDLMLLKEEYPHFKFLFGNHESLLLDAFNPKHPIYGDYYLWWNQGGKETLDSFKPKQSLVGVDEYERYQNAIIQPKDLLTQKYIDFIKNLDLFYQNEDYFFVHGGLYPERSIDAHIKALEGITPENMTQGDMGYDMIWMRQPFIDSKYDWGKKIIFGHTTWPMAGRLGTDPENGEQVNHVGYPLIRKNKIGIDTMMHNYGRITAVILPDEEFVFSDFSHED